MYCIHCGEPVVESAKFCAACGQPVHRPDKVEEPLPSIQAPVADEPETRPESPATTDPSDPALKHLPKTTGTDKVSLDLDVKHSKENLQTVIEEYMSLCHRCPKEANGQPVYELFFLYYSVHQSTFVQANYGYSSTPLCPGIQPESTTADERKEGQWGFEIAGPPPKFEKELNSLGWYCRKLPGETVDIFHQEFSEVQVLRGEAAANIMDVFSRNEFSTAFMARVQVEAGVELIRLTEKDFEGGQIRRPEPAAEANPFRLFLALGGSVLFWFLVVSSGLFSALPWWLIFFFGLFNLFIFAWAFDEKDKITLPGEDVSRSPESSQHRRQAIRKQVKRSVWQRDQGRCVECGSKEKLEYDHIIPWSKGGSDTERNIQLLCERCNRTKSASI